jgi:hypothetical protein
MSFKELTRIEKMEELKSKESKFTKGKSSGIEIKTALLETLNNRLFMMIEEGGDPLEVYTFKEIIEDIKYLNKFTNNFYNQFVRPEVE